MFDERTEKVEIPTSRERYLKLVEDWQEEQGTESVPMEIQELLQRRAQSETAQQDILTTQ